MRIFRTFLLKPQFKTADCCMKFVVMARAIGGSRSATCESLISESSKKPLKINTFYSWTFMRRSAHAIL